MTHWNDTMVDRPESDAAIYATGWSISDPGRARRDLRGLDFRDLGRSDFAALRLRPALSGARRLSAMEPAVAAAIIS